MVYDVVDAKTGELMLNAVWMCDYFPAPPNAREHGMEQMQGAFRMLYGDVNSCQRPIVYNVGNFTAPHSRDTPRFSHFRRGGDSLP